MIAKLIKLTNFVMVLPPQAVNWNIIWLDEDSEKVAEFWGCNN